MAKPNVFLTPAQAKALISAANFVLAGDYLQSDGGPMRDEHQANALYRSLDSLRSVAHREGKRNV